MSRGTGVGLLFLLGIFTVAGIGAAVTSTDRLVVFAALLLVATGLAHSWLGDRFILQRLFRRSDLPRLLGSEALTRQTLRFAWHLTTLAWWGIAAILFASVKTGLPEGGLLRIVSVTFGASAILALLISRGRHPSWTVFVVVAIATWIAA